LFLVAPKVPAGQQPTDSTKSAIGGREDNWRADLAFFANELPARHVNAFKYVTREAFAQAVAEVDSAIPYLTDQQIRWRFMRLTALVRDGHTNAQMPMYPQRLPITTWWADDGPYITGAAPAHAGLVGRRIVGLNGLPIVAIADTIRRYLAHENEMGFRQRAGWILYYPGAQYDVGLSRDSMSATLGLEDADGRRSTLTLSVVPRAGFAAVPPPNGEPLYRQRSNEKYWIAYLPGARALFLKYNQCRDPDEFGLLTDSIARLLDAGATRLIIDLRHNSGGDSRVIQPLIEMIRGRPAINRLDALYTIIGRGTFSSGMAAAHDLRTKTRATIVGEPIGERPNTFGELRRFTLPHSHIEVTYSTEYYRLVPGEPDAFMPDVHVSLTPDAIVAGRDPVLEWIMARR
jgi:hypothetical protein